VTDARECGGGVGVAGASGEAILIAEHVEMTFTSPDSPQEALAEADLALAPNEFVSIIGPSGCGKSTLLRILAGLVRPTGGRVLLHGEPLTSPRRQVGFVFQHANLMPWRSTLRNVTLPLEIQGAPTLEAEARAREMLELVGLADFADALPRDLSGGMRQRVALARALAHDPEVLLLDEPFGALDALTRERMNWELLRIWEAQRKTVLMVTHDIQEAIFLSDRVLVMTARPGRIRREVIIDLPRPRSPDDLYTPRFMELSHTLRDLLR
jgi:NitT/TauT family transport system ATP-binding protein